ncbi:MAG: GGDEF domain-containing protein, partial [Endozoicomonas sp.]
LLPLFYWQSHQQNLQHAMAISAIAPTTQKRRIFEAALRKHLQKPEAPLAEADIPERILFTFEDVLPGMPVMILIHEQDDWHIMGDYSKTAESLRSQLPAIEDELFHVVASGVETKIHFKDRYGSIYWVFPLSIEDGHKTLLVLSPPRHHRNSATWQTTCDISSHACTLFQASRQSRFWRQQASLDALTGLLNRRAFCQEAELILTQSTEQQTTPSCCALFIDIDNFKQLNDRLGHARGDQVLKRTAASCRSTLRQEDLLGRYGGEEFVALLPNTEPWQAFQVAERIRSNIEKESGLFKNTAITLSIGLAALSSRVSSLDQLLEDADTAMYQAKQQGKNRTVVSTALSRLEDARLPLP